MSGTSSKEERRNLRKEMGAVAAAAVVELQQVVRTVDLAHRTLARQMLEFETTVATVRQGRAADQARVQNQGARVDELAEQLEALTAKLGFVSERCEALLGGVARLDWWAQQRAKLSRWQRFASFFTGRCAVTLEQYDIEQEVLNHPSLVPRGPVVYIAKDDGPLQRVSATVASGDPLPWRSAHQGAREGR